MKAYVHVCMNVYYMYMYVRMLGLIQSVCVCVWGGGRNHGIFPPKLRVSPPRNSYSPINKIIEENRNYNVIVRKPVSIKFVLNNNVNKTYINDIMSNR